MAALRRKVERTGDSAAPRVHAVQPAWAAALLGILAAVGGDEDGAVDDGEALRHEAVVEAGRPDARGHRRGIVHRAENTIGIGWRRAEHALRGNGNGGAAQRHPSQSGGREEERRPSHLSFNVARLTSASTTEMIQKRTTTVDSRQPFSSK